VIIEALTNGDIDMKPPRILLAILLLAPLAVLAQANDLIVRDAASLRDALRDLKPGTTLKIAPGEYPGGHAVSGIEKLTIEALDPKQPPVFKGGKTGFQFSRCADLTLSHLHITGQSLNGLNLDDGGDLAHPVTGITLDHIEVSDIGPQGNHDAIKCSGLDNATIRDCTITGWGGQGIDFVGCHRSLITGCRFIGKEGFSASAGIQLKGGTSDVTVEMCHFTNAGERPLNLGGSTGLPYFRPQGAKHEAARLIVRNNTIEGSLCAAAFVGVDGAEFVGNIIVYPEKWIFRILQETREPGFVPCRNVLIKDNRLTFRRSQVQTDINLGEGTAPETFRFENNHWYAEDKPQASKPQLPVEEKGGVYGQAGEVDHFNSILGTQAIGGKYQFTDKPALIESAEAIRDMGATSLKFALRLDAKHPTIHTVAQLVSLDPVYRQVIEMPFADFQMWVDARAEGAWSRGLKPAEVIAEYRQVYDLAVHLLKSYSGTGKSFYLGHWEGDNMLRGSIEKEGDAKMADAVRVQGFIAWLMIRQQAVDNAKRDTPHHDVNVWHYTEVNHPTISLREGRPSIANRVLPFVPIDFVSYSAYDGQEDPKLLRDTLDYLESKLKPKPNITGKRVFIGEYGFWTQKDGIPKNTPQQQNDRSLEVIRVALEWGCPFILYWQFYNNELDAGGSHRGFWMIDDKGVKQPIYETHRRYYDWSKMHVAEFKQRTGRRPTDTEFRTAALDYLRQ